MCSALPRAAVLRSMSDESVMRALVHAGRSTRAELAAATGLSKPTVGESVRRLAAKGLVRDTGQRTASRGGVGTYYAPAGAGAGLALAVAVAPEGIAAEALEATGACVRRIERPVERPVAAAAVRRQLRSAARAAVAGLDAGPVEVAVVSAADPVDRTTGRLIHLPDAAFLIGELDPVTALSAVVAGEVHVDNDVNWAARHEHAERADNDFAYLFLGDGLGCAVVADGQVRRGHAGIAGEIAHLLTAGPDGQALPFTAVFAELGLRQPRSTAIDSPALTAALDDADTLAVVARAVAGVISALVALTDPAVVVLAGSWGTDPRLLTALRHQVDNDARPVAIDVAREPTSASFAGARTAAVHALRELIAARSRA